MTSKLLTTKWPLAAVLVELARQCDALSLDLEVRWRPRDTNREADALSNFVFDGFDPAKRVEVAQSDELFALLPQLPEKGSTFLEELRASHQPAGAAEEAEGERAMGLSR